MQVEQETSPGGKTDISPPEVLSASGSDRRKEGIEPAHFLDEIAHIRAIGCRGRSQIGKRMESMRQESDIDRRCDGWAQNVQQFDGGDLGT